MKKIIRSLVLTSLVSLPLFTSGCRTPMDINGAPYEITNLKMSLEGPVVKESQLNAYIRTLNGIRLEVWELTNSEGKRGLHASGRTYDRHFVEYATDKEFLSGNSNKGPRIPAGYTAKKIN